MNSKHEDDLQYRLEKLEAEVEAEVNSSPSKVSPSQKIFSPPSDSSFSVDESSALGKFVAWFTSLSKIKKIGVVSVLVVFGFAMLEAALKLVASAMAFALLAVLAYLGYKFVVPSKS